MDFRLGIANCISYVSVSEMEQLRRDLENTDKDKECRISTMAIQFETENSLEEGSTVQLIPSTTGLQSQYDAMYAVLLVTKTCLLHYPIQDPIQDFRRERSWILCLKEIMNCFICVLVLLYAILLASVLVTSGKPISASSKFLSNLKKI